MDDCTRRFIERSTLLFIASRDADGAMDVSPRGGQPCVVRLRGDGCLLLPDYIGNRRLDTLSNVLSNPDVALVLLNRGCEDYLRVAARAAISRHDDDIGAFPADENPPLSVLVLTPTRMEFVQSEAFRRSGFWIDPADRKPPLDALGIYASDGKWQVDGGRQPVLRDVASEDRLAETGLRDVYGTPSALVQNKAFSAAGPGFMDFIDEARFIVLARQDQHGGLSINLVGGSTLRPQHDDDSEIFVLDLDEDSRTGEAKDCALLAVEPGRCDNLRLNGVCREGDGPRRVVIQTDEVFLHCSAAFARSRIWNDTPPTAWTGLRRFVCTGRSQESPDVVSFVFSPRDRAPVGGVLPGQYVTVSLPGVGGRPASRRCYSVSGTPGARALRITVRRIDSDGMSARLHRDIDIGSEVLLGPPAGRFVLDAGSRRPVVLVSAGVGVTPLLPMLEQLSAESDGRPVWFVHAARSGGHHLFRQEVQRAAQANPAIRLLTAYSQPGPCDDCDHRGRLDASVLAAHLPVDGCDFYLCGPAGFMTSVRQGLVDLGAAPECIRTEAFEARDGGTFAGLITGAAEPCGVTFARSDRTATWTPESGSLLDLALANGVDVQYSCRNGECQSCTQRIVSGKAAYPAGEEPLLARGQVLLCQAIPRGDVVLDC
ncbi:pyridoxamine 5'-phosphate oxidase family protein [Mesorhizobium sp. CAU 1741]|uniref:2Fe-2S iron-sulfur cluster-binding protein n=1 Tax=Mesorhizobium sp. CAU 1741 TaxID=3140366 RepID=UPI00325AB2C8